MSTKVGQLENQQDRIAELDFKKFKSNDKTDMQNNAVETTGHIATHIAVKEFDKNPNGKINIEINIFQRTTVFSSDMSKWI